MMNEALLLTVVCFRLCADWKTNGNSPVVGPHRNRFLRGIAYGRQHATHACRATDGPTTPKTGDGALIAFAMGVRFGRCRHGAGRALRPALGRLKLAVLNRCSEDTDYLGGLCLRALYIPHGRAAKTTIVSPTITSDSDNAGSKCGPKKWERAIDETSTIAAHIAITASRPICFPENHARKRSLIDWQMLCSLLGSMARAYHSDALNTKRIHVLPNARSTPLTGTQSCEFD